MVAMAIQAPAREQDSVERTPWTSEDWRDVFVFFAKAYAVVCAAVLLYSAGPVLGVTLVVAGLAAWPLLRSQPESAMNENGDGSHVTMDSPTRRTDRTLPKNNRFASTALPAGRSVQ